MTAIKCWELTDNFDSSLFGNALKQRRGNHTRKTVLSVMVLNFRHISLRLGVSTNGLRSSSAAG